MLQTDFELSIMQIQCGESAAVVLNQLHINTQTLYCAAHLDSPVYH